MGGWVGERTYLLEEVDEPRGLNGLAVLGPINRRHLFFWEKRMGGRVGGWFERERR